MKTIELSGRRQSLEKVLELAAEEDLILTTSDGRQFVLAEIRDFENEIRLVREQKELTELLNARSTTTKTRSLEEVKERPSVNRGERCRCRIQKYGTSGKLFTPLGFRLRPASVGRFSEGFARTLLRGYLGTRANGAKSLARKAWVGF